MDNFEFFGLNVAKLSNYVQYFSSNIAEGVAESRVEVEISWWRWMELVEMGARFSNTHFFYIILLLKYST